MFAKVFYKKNGKKKLFLYYTFICIVFFAKKKLYLLRIPYRILIGL